MDRPHASRRPAPAAFAAAVAVALASFAAPVGGGVGKTRSLLTGEPIGSLAVGGRLDIDLHAEFMLSRTFEKDTALNWYNCGYSGGGRNNQVGGNFGDFGLHVRPALRDLRYPRAVTTPEAPAVRFDGDDILKANFPVEDAAAGREDFALELWLRDENPAAGEVVLGWQSAEGRAKSAPLTYPRGFDGSRKWRHLVVCCTGESETWWLDGRRVAAGPRRMVIAPGHRMVLGGASAAEPSFAGDLAAVRLHEKALSPEQVLHNYRLGVMGGTEMHSWWRTEPEKWWVKESAHFRHCVDRREMAAWSERDRQRFLERIPGMFELAERLYRLYSERHALRIGVVSSRSEFRGDGIRYRIPIQPSKGSFMGWDGRRGFGWACQGAGHINPHELVHGCQGQTGGALQGNYWEAHANFPQTYLGIYQTLPPTTCARVCMFFPANGRCYYHARLMFEHLAQTSEYGPMFISKLWYDAGGPEGRNEYPWLAFGRFDPDPNTSMAFEWARMAQRCVTWDFRIFGGRPADLYRQDAQRGRAEILRYGRVLLEPVPFEPGWWRPPVEMAPQQFGWNICPLKPTGREATATLGGYVNPQRGSDWRAGFVGVDAAGRPRYGKIAAPGETLRFPVGPDAKQLYLVVCATPEKILPVPMTGDFRAPEQERMRYKVALGGCEPLDVLAAADPPAGPGRRHPNGGGFVAAGAHVERTAYVGPHARVLGRAKVLGRARIEDHAVVKDSATVRDEARVGGHAMVSGSATVRDRARLWDYAVATGNVVVRDDARILQHGAAVGGCREVAGAATIQGVAWAGGRVGGSAILDGQYRKNNLIDAGVWFTWSWGIGQNPGEHNIDLGGLYAQYLFEKPHPTLATDTWGATHALLHGAPTYRKYPARKAAKKYAYTQSYGRKQKVELTVQTAGTALVLNGRDQWLELPPCVARLREMSLVVTFRCRRMRRGARLVEFAGDADRRMYLTAADETGRPALVVRRGGVRQAVRGPAALPEGRWVRLGVVLTGGEAVLRLDGRTVARAAVALRPEDLAAEQCFVGRSLEGDFFAGELEDVSIYSVPLVDRTPPRPDPAAWAVPPLLVSEGTAVMRAVAGADPLGGVEYLFEETTGAAGGDGSGWQKSPVFRDEGLRDGARYAWRVKMRDVHGNETAWSPPAALTCARPEAFAQGADGLVVIEAEHFARSAAAPDGHAWKVDTSRAGFVGGGAMRALPDRGAQVSGDIVTAGCRLDYPVRFRRAGPHWLWVRAFGVNPNGDSLHVGVDLEPIEAGRNVQTRWGRYVWLRHARPLAIPSAGLHTVSVWMREDGVVLDRFLLTPAGDYRVPGEKDVLTGGIVGPGPAESPRK